MSRLAVIPQRILGQPIDSPTRWVYHLPVGPWQHDATFQKIHCGGGIAFPWRELVERDDVCRDCLKAAKR